MKKYIIWPMLVPSLAFCHDETLPQAVSTPQGTTTLSTPGTNENETRYPHRYFGENPFEDGFPLPPGPPSISIEGTVTETDDPEDTYDSDPMGVIGYDAQDVDDSADDTDDSKFR